MTPMSNFNANVNANNDLGLLYAMADLFAAPNLFQIGKMITPRIDSGMKSQGDPHVVIEIDPVGFRDFSGDSSHSDFGARLNVRVAKIVRCDEEESICTYWVEHHRFEAYTNDHHSAYALRLATIAALEVLRGDDQRETLQ
jgi:hypothetical protein